MKLIKPIKTIAVAASVCGLVACGPGEVTKEVEYDGTEEAVVAPEEDEAPPPIDLADMSTRPVDEQGNSATDLDMLNEALETAMMRSTTAGGAAVLKGKTMEEQMNSNLGEGAAQINTVEDLVKAGVIKAVPAAPDGKKYVIEGGVVVLK